MPPLTRRDFLAGSAAFAGATLLPARASAATDSRVEVLLREPIGRIAPEVQGHFVEHLGGVVYDGIWVGEDSKIPNDGGIRRALVEHMKKIKAPLVRWPGGCFADSYDWRDGIGTRESRPTRTNFWAFDPKFPGRKQLYEPNEFGTNDFLRFCQQIGAKPYVAANLRSLTPLDFNHWVEYCNAPAGSTTLAKQRGGEPFNVTYWGVGNESWGCGGNFTAEEYATEYRRYTAWVPGYGQQLQFIAAGPNAGEIEWTRGFFDNLLAKGRNMLDSVWGWGLHHYSWNVSQGRTTDWNAGKGDALKFTVEEWYELLRQADRMETLITSHWTVMGEFDPTRRVKLAVDEWGSWHKPGTEIAPSHQLGQQCTLRDALVAGITLDIFNRHADKVGMGAVAQLVNCLHSLFLADGDRFIVTPNYHVFAMHADHQGAESLRTIVSAPRVDHTRGGKPASFWGLSGSASLKDKRVVLTLVNPAATEARDTEIVVRGAGIQQARWTQLTSPDLAAHNTFTAPDAVQPTSGDASVSGGTVLHRVAPASVTKLELMLS